MAQGMKSGRLFASSRRKSKKKTRVNIRKSLKETAESVRPSEEIRLRSLEPPVVTGINNAQVSDFHNIQGVSKVILPRMFVNDNGLTIDTNVDGADLPVNLNSGDVDLVVGTTADGAVVAVSKNVDDADLAVDANANDADLAVSANVGKRRVTDAYIEGRRVVDIGFLYNEIHRTFDDHAQKNNCLFSDWKLVNTCRRGFLTQLFFDCQNCGNKDSFWSEPIGEGYVDVNTAAAVGTLTTGIGLAQLEELFASMNVSCMSEKTYIRYRESVIDDITKTTHNEMKLAGAAEKELALQRGDIHKGVPYISVVVDGSWMKRSYGTNYDSLSGVGAIIGYHTGKVLFTGVRNKFCAVCDRAQRGGTEPKQHKCYKNFDRNASSTSMETDAIVEGFKSSLEVHGLIYKMVVADGDSNVYKSIRDNDPYRDQGVQMKKIECTNHLLRNLCKKIKSTSETTQLRGQRKSGFVKARNAVKGKILTIRREVVHAATRWREDKQPFHSRVKGLQNELLGICSHVFGEHKRCGDRECHVDGKKDEKNIVPDLKVHGLYQKLLYAVEYISCFSDSLLFNLTNNAAESFNAIVCKDIGGKRINFGFRGSYNGRVAAAAVQFNTQEVLTKYHESTCKTVTPIAKRLEKRRKMKVQKTKLASVMKGRKRGFRRPQGLDKHYGPNSERPDVDHDVYEHLRDNHLKQLSENAANWKQIECDTREQSQSELWITLRQKMLTASNFGPVCRMRPTTSCAAKVKEILYPPISDALALTYGHDYEETARKEMTIKLKKETRPSGLFVDQEFPFLGASPDGLIDEDGLVEIKCPLTAKNFTAEEATEAFKHMKGVFNKKNPDVMNRSHRYFYQVQGQMHVSRREYCVFVVWSPKYIKWIRVDRDDIFWDRQMKLFLIRFYNECMLPEILDSRFNRRMPIRNPDYITKAIEDAKQKKMVVKLEQKPNEHCDIDRTRKPRKRSISETAIFEQDDECVIISHKKGAGFTPEEAKLFRNMLDNKTHSLITIRNNVLPVGSRLDDDSLDEFLRIVRDKYGFETQSVEYMYSHSTLVEPVQSRRSVQLIGGNVTDHWRCLAFDGTKLRVYDSLPCCKYSTLAEAEKEYIRLRYPTIREIDITFPKVQRQPAGVSCGVYASAFATTVVLGRDPCKERYSKDEVLMRRHFLRIIEDKSLFVFPQD